MNYRSFRLTVFLTLLLLAGSCSQPQQQPSMLEAQEITGSTPLRERYTITWERDYATPQGKVNTVTKSMEDPAITAPDIPSVEGVEIKPPEPGTPTAVIPGPSTSSGLKTPQDECEYFNLPITPTPPQLPTISREVASDDRKLNLVLVAHIEAIRNHIYNARRLIRGEYKNYMEHCHPDKKVVFDYRVQ